MTVESSPTEEGYLSGVEDAAQTPASTDANLSDAPSGSDDTNTEGATKPTSVMDAVAARMKEDGLDGESPAPKTEGDKEKPAADAKPDGEAKPEGDEADEEPPFHKHPAWQKQIAKRQEAEARVDELAPKAERFDQMQTMMRENDLSSDEVSAGFNIMALMKGDPARALEALQPYYDALQLATGHTLPGELNERVTAGELSAEDARELQRAKIDAENARRQAEATERRSAESAQAQIGNDIVAGISEWESAWQAKDPDYARKLPFVEDKIKAIRLDNPPTNRAEAVKLADDALKAVEAAMKPFAPRKPEVKPTPDGSSVNATQAPRNSLEAAKAALANMNAA